MRQFIRMPDAEGEEVLALIVESFGRVIDRGIQTV